MEGTTRALLRWLRGAVPECYFGEGITQLPSELWSSLSTTLPIIETSHVPISPLDISRVRDVLVAAVGETLSDLALCCFLLRHWNVWIENMLPSEAGFAPHSSLSLRTHQLLMALSTSPQLCHCFVETLVTLSLLCGKEDSLQACLLAIVSDDTHTPLLSPVFVACVPLLTRLPLPHIIDTFTTLTTILTEPHVAVSLPLHTLLGACAVLSDPHLHGAAESTLQPLALALASSSPFLSCSQATTALTELPTLLDSVAWEGGTCPVDVSKVRFLSMMCSVRAASDPPPDPTPLLTKSIPSASAQQEIHRTVGALAASTHGWSGLLLLLTPHLHSKDVPRTLFDPHTLTFFAKQKAVCIALYLGAALKAHTQREWCGAAIRALPSLPVVVQDAVLGAVRRAEFTRGITGLSEEELQRTLTLLLNKVSHATEDGGGGCLAVGWLTNPATTASRCIRLAADAPALHPALTHACLATPSAPLAIHLPAALHSFLLCNPKEMEWRHAVAFLTLVAKQTTDEKAQAALVQHIVTLALCLLRSDTPSGSCSTVLRGLAILHSILDCASPDHLSAVPSTGRPHPWTDLATPLALSLCQLTVPLAHDSHSPVAVSTLSVCRGFARLLRRMRGSLVAQSCPLQHRAAIGSALTRHLPAHARGTYILLMAPFLQKHVSPPLN